LSGREIAYRFQQTPGALRRLNGLLVSHEHSDHVRGVGVLSRQFGLPVFLTRGTLQSLPPGLGPLARTAVFQSGKPFVIGDLEVTAFTVPHDAAEPVGFVVENGGCRLGVCTDLGSITDSVKAGLQGCHALVLEANHDVDLLIEGPYPSYLKQRILSPRGHLCNTDTCRLLRSLYHDELLTVVLTHLSETNNHPTLVRQCLKESLDSPSWEAVHFALASQHRVTPGIRLGYVHQRWLDFAPR
jgi:phosphoribosyl 1,2-cyclic phosphodiesterase